MVKNGREDQASKGIEIRLRKDKILQNITTKRLEREIAREIKDDLFLVMLFDDSSQEK